MEMTTKTRSKSSQQRVKKIISYVVMSIIGIVLLIPLLWMVFTSLKPMEEIVRYPPVIDDSDFVQISPQGW